MDKVYLTENDSEAPLREALQEYTDTGFVSYRVDGVAQAQLRVYAHCLQQYRHLHNWIAFFDVDEFLVVRDQCAPLQMEECWGSGLACLSAHP